MSRLPSRDMLGARTQKTSSGSNTSYISTELFNSHRSDNVWLDEAYYQGLLSPRDEAIYLKEVETQKAEAVQNLYDKQSINLTDLEKTTNWWANRLDPYTYVNGPVSIDYTFDFHDVFNPKFEPAVNGRWLWNTQRFTLDQAIRYGLQYATYWNQAPIAEQDALYVKGNMPKAQIETYLENKKNTMERAKEEIDVSEPLHVFPNREWSANNDVYYSTSQTPVEQRWMYNTARYTKEQAAAYELTEKGGVDGCDIRPYNPNLGFPDRLRYYEDVLACKAGKLPVIGGIINPSPANKEKCNVEPWTGSVSDILRYTIESLKCGITTTFQEFLDWLEKAFAISLEVVLGILIVGGILLYKNRNTIASGAKIVVNSPVGNLIPGKKYYEIKRKEAARKGISVSEAIGSDISNIYNPIGIAQNLAQEEALPATAVV